jgi:AcrR family transcriptional regulator
LRPTINSPSSAVESAKAKAGSGERRYGGLSAQERSQQRRQKLLEAAIQAFGTLGLAKTTIRDICNEAGLAERYFSDHFERAPDAYAAVFKLLSKQALVAVGVGISGAPLNTIEMARAGLTAFLQFVKEDPRRARILLIDSASYWGNVTIRSNSTLSQQAQNMKHFSQLIYPGLPADMALEIVAASLLGSAIQSCLNWVQNDFKQPIEQVVQAQMFVWEGLDRWLSAESARATATPAVKPAA